MTLFIKIIFILSCDVLIFNLPESHGIQNNQGYHVSTISQVLTPGERFMYVFFGTLPNRIYYSYEKRCYVVRGQTGHYKNDLRRKKGKRYKVIPRWQYYLSKLSPMNLIQSGLEFVTIGKTLVFGGGLDDVVDDDLDDGTDGDVDGGTGGDVDGGTDDGSDDGKDNEKEPGLLSKGMDMGMGLMSPLFNLFGGSNGANNNNDEKKDDDNDKKDEKKDEEPGLLSKGMDMGMGLMSPLFNLFGGSNGANNNNDEKKDDDNDKKDEKKDEEPGLLSKGMDMGMGLMSPLFNLFGGSNGANNKSNDEKKNDDNDKKDEKKDDNKDDKEGDKPAESQSYVDMAKNVLDSDAVEVAKDVLQSDTAKEAVKTGIEFLVPGGPAIVAAINAAEKYQKADATIDKMEDKVPKLK